MKLRIKDNSIRLRLTQTDVDTLAQQGVVKEQLNFTSTDAFHYNLETKENILEPGISYDDNKITIYIPEDFSRAWPQNNVVGTSALSKAADGTEVFILIEKDFKCLDDTSEDQSDNFANPKLMNG